ncbi:putative transcription factor interactor and regulator CCHC(Zn) family [Helianthus annuus]|nr:putative transcription factor interactor and regulator CCHC(Zn) family [Helianthus annuus]
MVEKSIPGGACSNVNTSSLQLGSEIIITDAKNKFENTNEIIRTPNDVKDAKRTKENEESKDIRSSLEISQTERSNNSVVLRKLLRGPRYFDPPDSSYGNCYSCGERGHTITNCSASKRKKPCYLCGSLEHIARRCKQGKKCFHCKQSGHRAKHCPEKCIEGVEKAKTCLKCGDSGHEMNECETVFYSVDDLKEIQCYICKYMGHLCCVDYGEGPSEASCYRCGQLGHTGLKCESVTSSVITHTEASPSYCYKCGQEGHKSRKCKTSSKRKWKKAKRINLQDNTEHVAVKSAPQELGEVCKRNKTQHGYSTSSQPKRRGGWMDDDEDEDHDGGLSGTQCGSLSTPASYRSNQGFHGSSDYVCDFQYEG